MIQEESHHNIQPETVDILMKDHIFILIIETLEESEDLKKLNSAPLPLSVSISTVWTCHYPALIRQIAIFQSSPVSLIGDVTMPTLPKHIKYVINLKGSINKARLI